MKVKELMEKLAAMDPELDVWVSASDGDDLCYDSPCCSVGEAYLDERYGGVFLIENEEDEKDADGYPRLVLIS